MTNPLDKPAMRRCDRLDVLCLIRGQSFTSFNFAELGLEYAYGHLHGVRSIAEATNTTLQLVIDAHKRTEGQHVVQLFLHPLWVAQEETLTKLLVTMNESIDLLENEIIPGFRRNQKIIERKWREYL